jgi:RNA polymerase sigma-B factor
MQLAPAELDSMLSCYALKHDVQCRDRIIEAHLYIAEIVARKFSGRGVDYDDLYQVAAMALLKALDRFELDRGIKFASFATPAMVGEVKNYFRDRSRTVRLPRRSMELMRRVNAEKEKLYQELGRYPRVDELAERLDMPEDDIIEALEAAASNPVSLDMQTADDDEDFNYEEFDFDEE